VPDVARTHKAVIDSTTGKIGSRPKSKTTVALPTADFDVNKDGRVVIDHAVSKSATTHGKKGIVKQIGRSGTRTEPGQGFTAKGLYSDPAKDGEPEPQEYEPTGDASFDSNPNKFVLPELEDITGSNARRPHGYNIKAIINMFLDLPPGTRVKPALIATRTGVPAKTLYTSMYQRKDLFRSEGDGYMYIGPRDADGLEDIIKPKGGSEKQRGPKPKEEEDSTANAFADDDDDSDEVHGFLQRAGLSTNYIDRDEEYDYR
jgi:hypothetical protein